MLISKYWPKRSLCIRFNNISCEFYDGWPKTVGEDRFYSLFLMAGN